VGYLPEHNPLYLDMYIKEYLSFVAGLHMSSKTAETRVKEMIEMTGLTPEQNKKIGALSKGYRQRVGLAQAMIHDPEVLILDEPTSGLDPNQLVDIRSLVREIGKLKTVVLSTHIMQEVEAICNRVIIINQGRIVADDTTAAIQQKTTPEPIFEVEFDGQADAIALGRIPGVKKVTSLGSKGWQIRAIAGADLRGDLFEFAVKNNLKVLMLQRTESSLEDVFHQLTGKS
jgi:ABC-2 type transport system ATP-binding protein